MTDLKVKKWNLIENEYDGKVHLSKNKINFLNFANDDSIIGETNEEERFKRVWGVLQLGNEIDNQLAQEACESHDTDMMLSLLSEVIGNDAAELVLSGKLVKVNSNGKDFDVGFVFCSIELSGGNMLSSVYYYNEEDQEETEESILYWGAFGLCAAQVNNSIGAIPNH